MQLTKLIELWPLVVVSSLASAMCISLGDFFPIVGADLFVSSLDDIAISVFSLLLLFGVTLTALQLADEVLKFRGWPRIVSIVALVSTVFIQKGYFAYAAYWQEDWSLFYDLILLMVLSLLALVAFFMFHRIKTQGEFELNFERVIGIVIFPAIVCVIYGLEQFYSDFHGAYPVRVEGANTTVEGLFLTERSDFLVILDPNKCEYAMFQKSSISARILATRKKQSTPDGRNRCLHPGS